MDLLVVDVVTLKIIDYQLVACISTRYPLVESVFLSGFQADLIGKPKELIDRYRVITMLYKSVALLTTVK